MPSSGRNGVSLLAVVAPAVLASACGNLPDPGRVTAEVQPRTPVVRNITSFTNALRCMDDLLQSYGKSDIVITSDGLPDKTGQITTGTKEMMISAVSRMSARSGAFRFVDVDRTQDSVFWIQQNWIGVRDGLLAPNYYIRGAITQVDARVMTDSESAGGSIPWLSFGVSRDQLVSVVSMDLNIGHVVTRQIMPGLSSTNSIAVVKTGQGQDTEGLIDKAGIFFEVSGDRSQGSHQSVRTLVELGLVEVLGKLTRVPYWRCLQIDSTNPQMIAEARDWFDRMDGGQRVRLVQGALRRYGVFHAEADGERTPELDDAVSRYQDENDLIAHGRIDFDLYYSLLANDLAIGADDRRRPERRPICSRRSRRTGTSRPRRRAAATSGFTWTWTEGGTATCGVAIGCGSWSPSPRTPTCTATTRTTTGRSCGCFPPGSRRTPGSPRARGS